MNEHSFIDAIHRKLPATSPDFLKWKINDRFAGGTADAYYACATGELWAEYKYIPTYPKRDTTQMPIGLQPLQLAWLKRHHGFGIPTVVIVGCENDAVILKSPQEWEASYTKADFKKKAIPRKDIPTWIWKRLQKH